MKLRPEVGVVRNSHLDLINRLKGQFEDGFKLRDEDCELVSFLVAAAARMPIILRMMLSSTLFMVSDSLTSEAFGSFNLGSLFMVHRGVLLLSMGCGVWDIVHGLKKMQQGCWHAANVRGTIRRMQASIALLEESLLSPVSLSVGHEY
ncbi:hypothetical protein GOP47_0004745 [Adiantum capillus-veneris]|uniref:Uncharacterized protein n=1 Tax=Adiantum capillus-veneris TaxID=13818 RepID=A0A9D4V4L0_ADICA|nr:hypothetical protein GOP47_0004745 [Adiantum capillus-veneris]